MQEAQIADGRRALDEVVVDPVRVQESGLVKDAVVLDIPAEAGKFDSVLVRRAATKLKESAQRWQDYARAQGNSDAVTPRTALRLGRVSNLPTVWTNVMAGMALGGAALRPSVVVPLALAVSLFYVAGMWLNDAFDAESGKRL